MTYKVWIADDEPIVRKAMQTLIDWKSIGCELAYLAVNGLEVMERLRRETPDILVLDIQMPGKSGVDIARYIQEKRLPCKVILLTAYADFSYAQMAVKYDVVDYVIKTGAFDDLVASIEKAKTKLLEESAEKNTENSGVLKEVFLKSVFDGSLYQEEDIIRGAKEAGIRFQAGYLVVVCHFRMGQDKERGYTYSSLQNFFRMVFEQELVYSMAAGRDVMVLLLDGMTADFHEEIQKKCGEVIEMMDNFMKMYVYIGISGLGEGIPELKKRYDEAEYAEGKSFFDERSKINYFQGYKNDTKEILENMEQGIENLQYRMRKGNRGEAMEEFHRIIRYQKESGGSVSTILEVGIRICALCKKMLSDGGKTLHDITPFQEDLPKKIYRCRHVSEYEELMRIVIESTADYMDGAADRKSTLVCECEKYIDENFEKCITVSEISRHIGVSLSYLSRIFKEATGNTIINYINEKKVEKAREYLEKTDMKIYEIAEKLGFENSTYFSYFFKKYVGMSPKEYKGEGDDAGTSQ